MSRPTFEHATPLDDVTPDDGKHGSLVGGALTDEALASSRRVLGRARGNPDAFVGLQQWFSPPEAANLMAGVFGDAGAVLDPTAGSGALLAPFPEERRFGVEIDRDYLDGDSYTAIGGDAQAVAPMLRAAGLYFPAVALNPPFGLSWRDGAHSAKPGGEINSTVLAYLWALDLLARFGQGALICGRDRLATGILSRPEGRGVYAVVEVEGPLFEGVSLPTAIAFFVRPDNRRDESEEPTRLRARRDALGGCAAQVVEARDRLCRYVSGRADTEALRAGFRAVEREHTRRVAEARATATARRFDLSVKGGKVSAHLSAYAKLALAEAGRLREVQLLSGQHTSYFAQNPRAWRQLEELAADSLVSVDPALAEAAKAALDGAALRATPLFPVKPQMRLGWLADLDLIRCKKGCPRLGYEAGEEYPLSTRSKVASETSRRVVENRRGEPELRQFVTERRLLEIRIGTHAFDESADNIAYLLEHFDLPDPGCVASRFPETVAKNRDLLEEIARENGFALKPFQLDHLSRLLVKGRGVLAHEQGLGKTLMLMTLAEATARAFPGTRRQALFVVPQDLIPQWQREAEKFFGRSLEEIRTPAQARAVARRVRSGEEGWFITYYEALSVVGRKRELLPRSPLDHEVALRQRLAAYKREKRLAAGGDPSVVPLAPEGPTTRDACPACRATTNDGWDGESCPWCHYAHRAVYARSAYAHLTTSFQHGVKCVDELSEIRGDDSLRSRAVRALARGPHNYGATGTPLSNYINDAFWGLWFALGDASPAFPYAYEGGKAKFESDFCVIEHMMGREKDGESHLRKRRKILPQVTNVSQFWRLTQPGVSRCRKEQTGEPLVPRTYHPIRVPMGVSQKRSHVFWLENFAEYFAWEHPGHPLVKDGLVEKWAAALGQLWRLEFAATHPASDEPSRLWPVAEAKLGALSDFTPAALKVLELAMSHAAKGEKILIGSDLILTGKWLAERLCEKNVRAIHITEERGAGDTVKVGTKNPRKRAREVEAFVEGDAQVLCAGVGAMKLGHNLDVASAVIVHGLPYSFMALDQFLARVHRLTSTREVSVYVVVPRGSLAERKWELLKDKGGASDLAFDGELSVQPEKPVDWNKVLREMKARGIRSYAGKTGDEVLEADVEAAWKEVPPVLHVPTQAGRPKRRTADLRRAPPRLHPGSPPEYVQATLF